MMLLKREEIPIDHALCIFKRLSRRRKQEEFRTEVLTVTTLLYLSTFQLCSIGKILHGNVLTLRCHGIRRPNESVDIAQQAVRT